MKRIKSEAKPVVDYMPTPGKKITVIVVIIIFILAIVIAALYFLIIPRTCLSIETVYHERLGGGSTGGGINLNLLLTNDGTTEINGIDVDVTVINQTNVQMSKITNYISNLQRGENQEIKTDFIGNHFETYYISIRISFSSGETFFSKDLSYKTTEDSMNLVFFDKVED